MRRIPEGAMSKMLQDAAKDASYKAHMAEGSKKGTPAKAKSTDTDVFKNYLKEIETTAAPKRAKREGKLTLSTEEGGEAEVVPGSSDIFEPKEFDASRLKESDDENDMAA